MGSHSVTCHPTQVNTPRLHPSQTGRYSIYRPVKGIGLSKPRPRVQRATGPRLLRDTRGQRDWNPDLLDRKSSTLTTRLPYHTVVHSTLYTPGMLTRTQASRPRPGTRPGPRTTLSGYFTSNAVFAPSVLDAEGSTFKDNCVKSNKYRPMLSAAEISVNDCSVWQYKLFWIYSK